MTTATEPLLPAGTRLAHYEVKNLLGTGAMGAVYEAHDSALDRAVALKVLRHGIAEDPSFVDRFFREARAAARVSHPNLVHVYYVGKDGSGTSSGGGRAFFVMEVVRGQTLDEFVHAEGPRPLADALDLVIQAARGLGAAHAIGVVHRDVKPSNLLRREDGVVKITDFGLARSMDANVEASTSGLTGTPTYMSPEQCRGRPVDPRSDVYALGLVLWFLVVGRAPYASQALGEILHQQMNEPMPSAAKERPEIPPALDLVLARMCAKDPADRPASMDEAIALLRELQPRDLHLAPLMTRAVAATADFFIASTITSMLLLAVFGVFKLFQSPGAAGVVFEALSEVLAAILGAACFSAVLIGPELWWGTTAGKYLFGMRVVRADGTRAPVITLLMRLLLRYPVAPASVLAGLVLFVSSAAAYGVLIVGAGAQLLALLGGIFLYFLRDGLTLSDVFTRTRVVYTLGDPRSTASTAS